MTIDAILNELARFRDDIDMGKMPDRYDMLRFIDQMDIDLANAAHAVEDEVSDLRDEVRLAMGYQDQYLEQLEHAERHIEWLEHEFEAEIVPVDKYERACC